MTALADAVDHLLLGTSDLDAGIRWVETATGVKAAAGGSHPGRGTRNALIGLDGRRYLEIIAPDPAQPAGNLTMNLRDLIEPRLITWAAATTDIEALAKRLRDGRSEIMLRDGSRSRPDGRILKWRTLSTAAALADGTIDPIPFAIQWSADSPHPSQDSPKGCRLESFEIEHPDPKAVGAALMNLGIEATVRPAARVRLLARLDTPNGRVVIA